MYKLFKPLSNCIAIFGLSYEDRYIFGLTRTILTFYPKNIVLIHNNDLDQYLISKNINFTIKIARIYGINLKTVNSSTNFGNLIDNYVENKNNYTYMLNVATIKHETILLLVRILESKIGLFYYTYNHPEDYYVFSESATFF